MIDRFMEGIYIHSIEYSYDKANTLVSTVEKVDNVKPIGSIMISATSKTLSLGSSVRFSVSAKYTDGTPIPTIYLNNTQWNRRSYVVGLSSNSGSSTTDTY